MTDWLIVPGQPIGQGRPRCTCRGGKPRLYDPESSRVWKEAAAQHIALQMRDRECIDEGPVSITIEAFFKRPKSLGKGGRLQKPTKPDCDNIAKAVLDAATGRCFTDDAQVSYLMVSKFYASDKEEPSVRLRFTRA